MPIVFVFAVVVMVVLLGAWLWDFDPGAVQQRATELKEQCIVLKHEQNAEKFLDLECDRFVRYKQDK